MLGKVFPLFFGLLGLLNNFTADLPVVIIASVNKPTPINGFEGKR